MAVVGQVARPHGIRGQVILNPETDFIEERFRNGSELFVRRGGHVEPLTIEAVRFQQGRPVIAFRGVDSVDGAKALAGAELRIPREWLADLPAGSYYWHDLVGCAVETVDGVSVGTVREVDSAAGVARLAIDGVRGEVLVPLSEEICRTIDTAAKRIVIDPPDGLLDLNSD